MGNSRVQWPAVFLSRPLKSLRLTVQCENRNRKIPTIQGKAGVCENSFGVGHGRLQPDLRVGPLPIGTCVWNASVNGSSDASRRRDIPTPQGDVRLISASACRRHFATLSARPMMLVCQREVEGDDSPGVNPGASLTGALSPRINPGAMAAKKRPSSFLKPFRAVECGGNFPHRPGCPRRQRRPFASAKASSAATPGSGTALTPSAD